MSTVPVMDDSRREETPLLGSVSTFLELVPAAIYVCDAEGVIQQYNSKAAELWGRAPEAGDTCERYCGSKALYDGNGTPMPHAQTPMAEAIRTGQSFRNIEAQVERPAGDRVWVLVNIDPIRDETGRIIGAINCFSDITLRKLAEERLQESDALLHGIVDTSPDCIRVIRPDGTVAWINPAGLKMIDAKSPEALEDVDLADMVAPEHRALWRENHRRVCNGESLSWEFDAISFTGERRHVETHATPLRLPDGTVAHLGVTRDVTARKQSEAALRDIERRSEDILQPCLSPFTRRMPRAASAPAIRRRSIWRGASRGSASTSGASRWRCFVPTGVRCPMNSLPWPRRCANASRTAEKRSSPSGRTVRGSLCWPIPHPCSTPMAS